MAIFPGSAIPSAAEDYTIENSLRFNDGDSPYLARTMTSAGNPKKWTASFWFKRGMGATLDNPLSAITDSTHFSNIQFVSNTVQMEHYNGETLAKLRTTKLFRDPSAWYHLVFASDTTGGVADDRMKIYVNGVEVTDFDIRTNPSLNMDWYFNDGSSDLEISRLTTHLQYIDGYLAEYYYIDGTAYDADDFGETDEDTNQWIPIDASGLTFGTNGFYFKFQDSAAPGDDSSGNTNDFTATNLVATDQMIDTPTNNIATMNPVDNDAVNNPQSQSYAEGNLKVLATGSGASTEWSCYRATMALPSSGKWYWESVAASSGTSILGIKESSGKMTNNSPWHIDARYDPAVDGNSYGMNGDSGNRVSNGDVNTSYGTAFNASGGDIIGVAVDFDNDAIYFAINNT